MAQGQPVCGRGHNLGPHHAVIGTMATAVSPGWQQQHPGRVVQADDGDVKGDDELGLGDGLQGADGGHEVVGHEHSVRAWFLVQQPLHG